MVLKRYSQEEKDYLWDSIKRKANPEIVIDTIVNKYHRSPDGLRSKFESMIRNGEIERVYILPYLKVALKYYYKNIAGKAALWERNYRKRKKRALGREAFRALMNHRARAWVVRHREPYNAYQRRYSKEHPEIRKRINQKSYVKNKEKIKPKKKAYYILHKDEIVPRINAFLILNRERYRGRYPRRTIEEMMEEAHALEKERQKYEKQYKRAVSVILNRERRGEKYNVLFGDLFALYLKAVHKPYRTIAKEINVRYQAIDNWVRRESHPTHENIRKINNKMGLSFETLENIIKEEMLHFSKTKYKMRIFQCKRISGAIKKAF